VAEVSEVGAVAPRGDGGKASCYNTAAQVGDRASLKGHLEGEHLIEDAAHREEVTTEAVGLTGPDLGGSVLAGSNGDK
jgi:hypothetical protein